VPGFPIRTSSDPRSVDSSPRHIAASHVLHRLLMPRHPPCALKHLQHKKTLNKKHCKKTAILLRCSQPLSNTQTPHPTTKMEGTTPLNTQGVASGPNSVSGDPYPPPQTGEGKLLLCTRCAPLQQRTPSRLTPHQMRGVFRGAP
jgi:hypothetical protein